jgi:HSP20 family protein
MNGLTRWSPFEEMFSFQRDVDQLFNRFWNDAPARARSAQPWSSTMQVNASEQGWRIDVPLPGINPEHVVLEVAGNTLSIRAEEPGEGTNEKQVRYEQTITVPPFLDVENISATHRHGLLQLTVPLKESVKPRRVQIEAGTAERRQLTSV